MGWSLVPISTGDVVQVAQINEVIAAVTERNAAAGYPFTDVVPCSQGDTCLASKINEIREALEDLLVNFYNELTWESWIKADLFAHVFGAGRTNWRNTPARDAAGATYGSTLAVGTIMYREHLNELFSVVNELEYKHVGVSPIDGDSSHTLIPDVDWVDSKADAITGWEANIAAEAGLFEEDGARTGVCLMTEESGTPEYRILIGYGADFPGLYRNWFRAPGPDPAGVMPNVPGGFAINRITGCIADATGGTNWPNYGAWVNYSDELPAADDWHWGIILIGREVIPDEGPFNFPAVGMVATDIPYMARVYLMTYSHTAEEAYDYSFLEGEDWTDEGHRECFWSGPTGLDFKCNFDYH